MMYIYDLRLSLSIMPSIHMNLYLENQKRTIERKRYWNQSFYERIVTYVIKW